MVSYNLYAQVSANNSGMQLKLAAETFEEALRYELEVNEEPAGPSAPSEMAEYLAGEIKTLISNNDSGKDKPENIELIVYDENMGNCCIYLKFQFEAPASKVVPTQIDLDVTVKCIKGVPYIKNGAALINEGSDSGDYVLDDSESYTIKNNYMMQL